VPILDDTEDESNESVALMLSNPSGGAGLGSPSAATLTILDDDAPSALPGQLGFSAEVFTGAENAGSVTVEVRRTGGSSGAVSVDYATSDGSAQAGSDYTATSGTSSWADGETAPKTFEVPLLDDAEQEGSETVNLALSNPTNGATLGTAAATLTVTDDDATTDCVADADTLCLGQDGRFRAEIVWRDFDDNSEQGRAVDIDRRDSGLFYFFDENNIEMLLKVLDGCAINGHFWVFFAATTDVEFTLTVTDTENDTPKEYRNLLGEPAQPVLDVEAFAACP
ncbi:MAG: hypothetical protein MI919_08070, partial [Holophagales bacterium]|nr:hypothetical protein [Holophagales bacterium]